MTRSAACDRARAWASLGLDGELSELERRLFEAHVSRCAECAAFAEQVQSLVGRLRSTAPEPVPSSLQAAGWHRRPAVPAMRVASRAAAVVAAAAAGVAMFSLGAGSVGSPTGTTAAPPPIIIDATTTDTGAEVAELRSVRRATLLSLVPDPHRSGSHTGPDPL